MNFDDDDIVFPWEEGAPPAQPTVNFGAASITGSSRTGARKIRRSSILKLPSDSGSDRTALQDIGNSPKKKRSPRRVSLSRRVSFSTAHSVKEFRQGKDELTVWNRTYEEEREHSGNGSNINDIGTTSNVQNSIIIDKTTTLEDQNVMMAEMTCHFNVDMDVTHNDRMDLTCGVQKDVDAACTMLKTTHAASYPLQSLTFMHSNADMTSTKVSNMELTTCNDSMVQDVINSQAALDMSEMEVTKCAINLTVGEEEQILEEVKCPSTRFQAKQIVTSQNDCDESQMEMTHCITSSIANIKKIQNVNASFGDSKMEMTKCFRTNLRTVDKDATTDVDPDFTEMEMINLVPRTSFRGMELACQVQRIGLDRTNEQMNLDQTGMELTGQVQRTGLDPTSERMSLDQTGMELTCQVPSAGNQGQDQTDIKIENAGLMNLDQTCMELTCKVAKTVSHGHDKTGVKIREVGLMNLDQTGMELTCKLPKIGNRSLYQTIEEMTCSVPKAVNQGQYQTREENSKADLNTLQGGMELTCRVPLVRNQCLDQACKDIKSADLWTLDQTNMEMTCQVPKAVNQGQDQTCEENSKADLNTLQGGMELTCSVPLVRSQCLDQACKDIKSADLWTLDQTNMEMTCDVPKVDIIDIDLTNQEMMSQARKIGFQHLDETGMEMTCQVPNRVITDPNQTVQSIEMESMEFTSDISRQAILSHIGLPNSTLQKKLLARCNDDSIYDYQPTSSFLQGLSIKSSKASTSVQQGNKVLEHFQAENELETDSAFSSKILADVSGFERTEAADDFQAPILNSMDQNQTGLEMPSNVIRDQDLASYSFQDGSSLDLPVMQMTDQTQNLGTFQIPSKCDHFTSSEASPSEGEEFVFITANDALKVVPVAINMSLCSDRLSSLEDKASTLLAKDEASSTIDRILGSFSEANFSRTLLAEKESADVDHKTLEQECKTKVLPINDDIVIESQKQEMEVQQVVLLSSLSETCLLSKSVLQESFNNCLPEEYQELRTEEISKPADKTSQIVEGNLLQNIFDDDDVDSLALHSELRARVATMSGAENVDIIDENNKNPNLEALESPTKKLKLDLEKTCTEHYEVTLDDKLEYDIEAISNLEPCSSVIDVNPQSPAEKLSIISVMDQAVDGNETGPRTSLMDIDVVNAQEKKSRVSKIKNEAEPVQCVEKVLAKRVTTSSDLKPNFVEKKKMNIQEISIFKFLLQKQNAALKGDVPNRYGQFQIAELDLGEGKVIFSFKSASLRLVIRLGHPLPSEEIEDAQSDRDRTIVKHWTIRAMQFENPSKLMKSKNGDMAAKLAHFLLLRQLTSSWFHEVCPNTCSLKETLSKVSGFVHEAVRFVLDMYDISTSHSEFSVSDDYKIKIGFNNIKLYFAFTVEIDFSKGFSSAKKPENVNIQMKPCLYKNVKSDSLLQLIKVVPPGWKFIKILVKYIDTYCQELSARTRSNIVN